MRISVNFKLLFILILIPIISLLAYRYMVGKMILNDKITYVYDSLATKNTEKMNTLNNHFNEFEVYDHILIKGLHTKANLQLTVESILNSSQKINEIHISRFIGNKVHKIIAANSSGKTFINQAIVKYNLGAWKKGYVFKRFDENHFLLINRYKKDNQDYLVSKIINLKKFGQKLDEDKIYTTYLISKENKDILFAQNKLKKSGDEHELFKKMSQNEKILGGVKTVDINGVNYLIAFDEIDIGVILITAIKEQAILTIMSNLDNKSIILLIVAISFAGILSLFASRGFTRTLNELHQLATSITQGQYQVQIEDKPKDEIGDLAMAFEQMGQKVSQLLRKLHTYNKKLELLVEKRTHALKQAMDLQDSMINSVNEAFMIVNKDGIVAQTHSKASIKIFGKDPSFCRFSDLLQLENTEHESFAGLFNAMISKKAPFDELKQFLPHEVKLNDQRIIQIDYSPMLNQDGQYTNIVVTAEDKTREIISMQESEKQKSYAKMLLNILKDKNSYFDFIHQLKQTMTWNKNKMSKEELYRQVHTLKGHSGYYHIPELTHKLHELEDFLIKTSQLEQSDIKIHLDEVNQILQKITKKQKQWLGVNPYYEDVERSVSIDREKLEKFCLMMQTEDVSKDLYETFLNQIFSVQLKTIFEKYETLIYHQAHIENININKIQWNNFDIKVLPGQYEEIFEQFSHLYRNIVAHAFVGIEDASNEITTTAQLEQQGVVPILKLTISDNGVGINLKKLETCIKAKGLYNTNMDKQQLMNMIFEPGVTTNDRITQISGRGVGLSSIKQTLEKFQGEIYVCENEVKGTQFIIRFPLKNQFILTGDNQWKKVA